MIHQLIFAFPRPGMSEEAFQQYWVEEHATRYAAKIPQIRRYAVDTRVPRRGETAEPLWSGAAEIWLENEEEQIASLQSPEFLEGARPDEPRWAAFWRTLVLDTDTTGVLAHDATGDGPPGMKLILLAKRREGTTVEQFRQYSRDLHAPLVASLPGIRGYDQSYTRDGWYAVSEPPFDAAYHLWFDDVDAVDRAEASPEYAKLRADFANFVNPRYLHTLLFRQNWIIGPAAR